MLAYSEKAFLLPSLSLARNRIYSGTHLKEELTDLVFLIPLHRQRMVNTLLMHVRDSLEDEYVLFT